MANKTRETLANQIDALNDGILALGGVVQQAILGCVKALVERDLESAKNFYEQDKFINQKRYELEQNALITVATQGPKATDLRRLSSIIDIAGELERMGDYAKGIARITMRLGNQPPLKNLDELPRMAHLTGDMLGRALVAFAELDQEAGRAIPQEDDQVDLLYTMVYQELLELMIADRENIDRATLHLWVAHNLERAADRVTNICERTLFTITGELIEFDSAEDESEAFY